LVDLAGRLEEALRVEGSPCAAVAASTPSGRSKKSVSSPLSSLIVFITPPSFEGCVLGDEFWDFATSSEGAFSLHPNQLILGI
jgi:hypothetical protein